MKSDRYAAGDKVRREVNGDAVVDRILANADDFSMPIQDLVTEYCWGAVWARPDLDRRSRSILNIGMLAALNRPDELAGHLRGALNNGVSKAEIRECLLQVAVYAGMPAGMSAFKVAKTVFADLDV
ncbi:4-carboxymuconolactone decarboxylase [Amycolatopsis rubida]|uniref:4-carboxymuconolactone decarboxylase n=1 Tax=Amycolatopsis rubida TaxID=112413 RepID=A0ABX0C870_9PSEU|nr:MULTISPECIES: carboxymuconolactone decarboxylase family protein [Amycolatopsis]MYW96117.1 4-carboxymuconolactone decarboxylase [Amycolatopsis rubida]NEC61108.1 4-carboxymuconolactone decarboxylase [Amycolatopsis rubida]OAP23369.1 Carboxymuconolactone decarboxylase family protein [Amycolatopsis sp. M39]